MKEIESEYCSVQEILAGIGCNEGERVGNREGEDSTPGVLEGINVGRGSVGFKVGNKEGETLTVGLFDEEYVEGSKEGERVLITVGLIEGILILDCELEENVEGARVGLFE